MDSIKEVLLSGDYDADQIRDIQRYGCSGGVSGFIYYSETVKFHDEHENEIWEMLYQDSKDFGNKNVMEFISSMNGSGNVDSMDQLKNLLVWYAVEKIAGEIVDSGELPEEVEQD